MSERRRVLKFGEAVVLVPVNGERRGSSDNLSSPSLVTLQKSEKSSRLNTRSRIFVILRHLGNDDAF